MAIRAVRAGTDTDQQGNTMIQALQLTQPHEPTRECNPWHCWSHNVDELHIGKPYIMCGECFHTFRTKHALRRDYRKLSAGTAWRELFARRSKMLNVEGFGRSKRTAAQWLIYRWFIRASRIPFCPHCLHDL
jgi:hypothetical protein